MAIKHITISSEFTKEVDFIIALRPKSGDELNDDVANDYRAFLGTISGILAKLPTRICDNELHLGQHEIAAIQEFKKRLTYLSIYQTTCFHALELKQGKMNIVDKRAALKRQYPRVSSVWKSYKEIKRKLGRFIPKDKQSVAIRWLQFGSQPIEVRK